MDSTDYQENPSLQNQSFNGRTFNKRLDPRHLDISDDDKSCNAEIVRTIATFVSRIFKPRQVIVLLRLLKALTFCFLGLSIIADIMFIFFVQVGVSNDVNIKLGGVRDMTCRLYGVGLAVLATMIELDMSIINVHFAGLKPFLPRAMLLIFVSELSATSPMIGYERKQYRAYNKYNDDDMGWDYSTTLIQDEVPGSAVAFQSITSFILLCSALAYFVLGLMCLDRFTAPAFIADDDQVAAAVNATALSDAPSQNRDTGGGSFDSYDAPRNFPHSQHVNDGF
mmetsp:Transcript_3098/g.4130  ORF Transcript_3098/g.4130 Transcript_3098/m.4130 type:complete len:281 (+) Transcript_3098:317-1159(+)